jgi:hypothetical protein
MLAADDAPPADADTDASGQSSAKMGEEPGTHTGDDQGATPENDTQKVDQPPRRNETHAAFVSDRWSLSQRNGARMRRPCGSSA